MSIAKALFGLIGTAIIGLLVTSVAIPEWTLMNLELHFWQTIWGFLISAAFGGATVFIIHSAYIGWRLGDNPCGAFDELKGIEQLKGCKSLSDMIDPVKALSANEALIAELAGGSTEKAEPVESDPRYGTPSTDLIMQMAPVVAARTYKAYEAGEFIPLSDIEVVAIYSIGSKDGLFELKQFVNPFGQPIEAKEYGLTKAWRAFLDDPVHRKQLETVAGGWL